MDHLVDGSEFDAKRPPGVISMRDENKTREDLIAELKKKNLAFEKVEVALLESNEKYNSVIEALDEGIVFQLADGSIQTCNKSSERIFGLSKEQMMGRTSLDLRWRSIHEDGSPFPGETHPMMQTLRTGEPTSNVIMGIHQPNGELRWISINCNPLFHEDEGLPYAAVGSFVDITKSKLLEKSLVNSNTLLSEAERIAKVGSWQWNIPDNEFTFSKQWKLNQGVTKSSLSMDELMRIAHPDDAETVNAAFNDVLSGVRPRYDIEHRIIRQDNGEVRIVRAIGEVAERNHLGEPLRIIGYAQDITDRKLTEKELQAAERRFELVFEQTGSFCMILDPNTPDGIPVIVNANKAACDAHGYTRAEFIGRSIADVDDEEGKKLVLARTKEILSGKPLQVENIHVRKDGTKFPVIVYANRLDIDDGLPLIFTTEHDISKRKKAENALANSLKEKEILLKEIHHRVKNNLQVISSLLSLQANTETDQHTTEVLRESQRRIKIMANLHETLYRSDKMGSIDIRSYLDSIIKDMLNSFNSQKQKVVCEIDVEKIDFTISQSMALGQILGELLSNCFKHAFAGRQTGNIKVELHRIEDEKIEMIVVDDGNGFPNNFSVQDTKTLGLKLVQGLAQQLHGECSIDTSQNTCIRITMRGKPI